MKTEIIKKATTVQKAIQAGLEELGVERDQAEVKILDAGGGILSWFGLGKATVKVSLCQEEGIAAQHVCSEIVRRMGANALVSAKTDGDECRVTVSGGGKGLIGPHGEVIDALEYMLERILNKGGRDDRVRVYLDVDEYRLQREEELRALARRKAEEALRSNTLVEMTRLSSSERRVIHTYLKDYGRVETRSLGDGSDRRIQIYPKGMTPPPVPAEEERGGRDDRRRRRPRRDGYGEGRGEGRREGRGEGRGEAAGEGRGESRDDRPPRPAGVQVGGPQGESADGGHSGRRRRGRRGGRRRHRPEGEPRPADNNTAA